MGISRELKTQFAQFSEEEADRIIRMAWEDRTSFDAIKLQFGLSPNDVVRFMRTQLDAKAFARWRRRVHEQGHLKNEAKRPVGVTRFKCKSQRLNGTIKGVK
jgi:uncharacterized protein (TIGR03643 family)